MNIKSVAVGLLLLLKWDLKSSALLKIKLVNCQRFVSSSFLIR